MRWPIAVAVLAFVILFLANLGRTGFLGPDEPRYASIGREMARSGDWVTPHLDGKAWFEKPPLIYWMTATGRLVHLPDEMAARLPQVLLSIGFLVFFYIILSREYSTSVAGIGTAILATSVGWLVYSFVALTDLPMTVTLDAAVLLTVFGSRHSPSQKIDWLVGALLGLAILGKGFVPVVLFAPIFLTALFAPKFSFPRRLAVIAGALIVAAPWYVLCWLRNGSVFWDDFFWKQHVARFLTPSLEHVQPFWFYLPVLLAGLFPWTPLAGLLATRKIYEDVRVRILAAWVAYGFVFFSIARNKLPGYLLPLLPAVAILLALAVDRARRPGVWLALCGALLMLLPTAARIAPLALQTGIRRSHVEFAPVGFVFLAVAGVAWWLASRGKAQLACMTVTLATGATVVYFMSTTMPVLDRGYSVRNFYQTSPLSVNGACLSNVPRAWEYGLNYYAQHPFSQCYQDEAAGLKPKARIRSIDGRPVLEGTP